jgi:hypothetical protein
MRRILIFIIFMLFSITIFAKEKNKLVVVLIDLSESTNKPAMRELYLKSFKKVLDKITHGDAFYVAPITEKSMLELNFIIQEKKIVPVEIPKDTNILIEMRIRKDKANELKKKKEEIEKIVKDSLENQKRRIFKTDILSSLNMADERIFRVADFKEFNKMLVIMSDMIEDSKELNFEKENLTSEKINNIINWRKNNGLIPNLKDVKVYVVGAYAKTPEKFRQIREFWFKYFSEAGAILLVENYSPSCPVNICE